MLSRAMAHQLLVCLSALLLVALSVAEVPSYIQVCGRRNPQLDKCVEESVRKLTPILKNGIPELDVPPLEPLNVDRVALADLDEFRAVATSVKLSGLSNFTIKYLSVDLKNQKIDIEILFPRVDLDSDYDVQAKILVPISEKGPIHTITENVKAKVQLKFQVVERRGRRLLFFPTMTTKLTIDDYEAIFRSGQESPIVQAINSVLVSSRQEIIESMTPNLEKAISEKVLDVSNRICKHFTYDELFPDRP